ncbi:Signal transduction histidine kinase [Caballeronia sordidicola]|uniref:histidine kinase n=2 Tax=Burkholderiales TaxID=80840 RepID=A0A242N1Q2_CABSO|nr:Signal transduction histidine kinase [Caballeronia sordidicola]
MKIFGFSARGFPARGFSARGSSARSNPFNSLFGRMALISLVVLFAVQACWFAVLTVQRPHHDAEGYARGLTLVLAAANDDARQGVRIAPALNAKLVLAANLPEGVALREPDHGPIVHLLRELRNLLPRGAQIAVDGPNHSPRLWVRYPDNPNWIVTPVDLPAAPPILIESVGMLLAAVILSLVAAWQLQRPLSRVAQSARQFGTGERPVPVEERGPRELRDLIRAFNQMMRQINDADDEKAVMLAGIAHDLKAPLTRLKLRASVLVDDDAERAHFIRDIDSLTRIVQQFLEFAASTPSVGPAVGVDGFLAEQFAQDEAGEDALFRLELLAGDGFRLPRTSLDRLVTNLVDNALEHGAPPVDISTSRRGNEWVITVRDYGGGIPPERLSDARKPFVRLDPARAGDGHCGLGLAIVGRLARELGGRCEISNAPEHGLMVRIVVPVAAGYSDAGGSAPTQTTRTPQPVMAP